MAENAFSWSVTASDNDDADPAVPWPEGQLPSSVNNASRSLMAGVARLLKDLNGTLVLAGSSNTYTESCWSGHSGYTDGILITARAGSTNTGAATFNLNSFGAKNIRVFGSTGEVAVAAGQIQQNGTYQFRYDTAADSAAGAWILLNPSVDAFRVGDVKVITENALPAGWLYCNGAAVSRTTYAALFTYFGTRYGSGDGSTTFNLPDYCGRALFGKDDMGLITPKGRITTTLNFDGTTLGASGGAQSHQLSTAEIPSHAHTGTSDAAGGHSHAGMTDNASADHTHAGTTGSGGVDHTHPVNDATGKAFQFSGPGGNGWGGNASVASGGASAFAHTHPFTTGASGAAHNHPFTTGSVANHTHPFTTATTGSDGAHSIMPPAITVNFIVKY